MLSSAALLVPVKDLGYLDPHFQGIYSPGYLEDEVRQHIHGIFLDAAEDYLRFCPIDRGLIDHWKGLITAAVAPHAAAAGIRTVVDIGSGGGPTIPPILELYPDATVFATDLSLPLLRSLRASVPGDNLKVIQMNAERMLFADGVVDLVTGANVLHHAVSVGNMLREARRIVNPSGLAVFWEPIENGMQLLVSLFDLWLEMSPRQSEPLPEPLCNALRSFMADVQRRVGRAKPQELLLTLDDKWLFTASHLHELASECGFSSCTVTNLYGPSGVLHCLTAHELNRWGFDIKQLPQWAVDKLLHVQNRLSNDFLTESPASASIVLVP